MRRPQRLTVPSATKPSVMSQESPLRNKASGLLRQQLLIDDRVQGALLRKTALYSGCCVIYFAVIMTFTDSKTYPDQTFFQSFLHYCNEAIYWAPGLMLMSPVVVYDLLQTSNRFAGPVYRLQREMQKLINNEPTVPLTFRDGDYWIEMAVKFNQIRDELLELRGEQPESAEKAEYSETPQLSDEDRCSDEIELRRLFAAKTDDQESSDDNLLAVEPSSNLL
jgi:hypothetical protein